MRHTAAKRSHNLENIRRIIVDNYLVFYRVEEKVQILRIYHAARKWEDLFRAELE